MISAGHVENLSSNLWLCAEWKVSCVKHPLSWAHSVMHFTNQASLSIPMRCNNTSNSSALLHHLTTYVGLWYLSFATAVIFASPFRPNAFHPSSFTFCTECAVIMPPTRLHHCITFYIALWYLSFPTVVIFVSQLSFHNACILCPSAK